MLHRVEVDDEWGKTVTVDKTAPSVWAPEPEKAAVTPAPKTPEQVRALGCQDGTGGSNCPKTPYSVYTI